jgi:acetyl/propionyl-CoA carboxylase alpha subunit
VKLQIDVARGAALEGPPPAARGHAIEVRVNAEDPERGFAPAPGLIELFRPPGGAGLRVDSGFTEGDRVASEFDSMLAKIIAVGRDRAEALARLRRALRETHLAVRGGSTNKGFLLALLARPEVASGTVDVSWLDRLAAEGGHLSHELAEVALLQTAIGVYEAELAVDQTHFFATAARGRPRVAEEIGRMVELRHGGNDYWLHVFRTGPRDYRIEVDGLRVLTRMERLGPFERRLRVGERDFRVLSIESGADQLVEVDGVPHRVSLDSAGLVRAPAPAVVLSIAVEPGDEVERDDRLLVLEAMKTEQPVLAPFAGRVREVRVTRNTQVDAGQPLVVLEPVEREEETAASGRVRFDDCAAAPAESDVHARCSTSLEELRSLMARCTT